MIREHTQTKPRVQASRVSFFDDFPDVTPQPGTILVRTRAISARVNKNFDGFESEELKKAYRTFIGRPVFVNHQNLNYRQTRGIIRGSAYKEDGRDKHIDLLIEVDAKAYPRLAAEIEAGRLDGVSMGCDVGFTVCSYCGNVARDPFEFCHHVLAFKGAILDKVSENFEKQSILVYEQCKDVSFFEISFVFDPADETALVQEVYVPGGYHTSAVIDDVPVIPKLAFGETIAPPQVDTMREDNPCPQCGDEDFDGQECQLCQFRMPPTELQEPDLDQAKQVDLRQQQPNRQARRNFSDNPFVRRS